MGSFTSPPPPPPRPTPFLNRLYSFKKVPCCGFFHDPQKKVPAKICSQKNSPQKLTLLAKFFIQESREESCQSCCCLRSPVTVFYISVCSVSDFICMRFVTLSGFSTPSCPWLRKAVKNYSVCMGIR